MFREEVRILFNLSQGQQNKFIPKILPALLLFIKLTKIIKKDAEDS